MKRNVRWVIQITIVLVAVVILYYNSVNKEQSGGEDNAVVMDKDLLLSKDLEENYPLTVCQVVSAFTRIQKCYYNEDCSNEEIIALADMMRLLLDDELNENNPYDTFISNLETEINTYRKNNRTISRIIMGKSSEVKYSTVDGVKSAAVDCIYYVKDDAGTTKNVTTYILRKNDEGEWKIYGWQLYQPDEWEE